MKISVISLYKRIADKTILIKNRRVKAYKYRKRKPYREKLHVILFSVAGALAVTAAVIFFVLWNEGVTAQQESQEVLNASDITPKITSSPVEAASFGKTEIDTAGALAPTLSPELQGYKVIARLDIEKIGEHLPVLSETTDSALKVSACYYEGVMPGQDGNMVITGHNFANGAIFGKLDQMKAGDTLLLTNPDGITQSYTVYKINHITPDEPGALNKTEYARELTLVTCESRGNGRLLVRCCAD